MRQKAFSWKQSLDTQLHKLKERRRIYLKNGNNTGAKDVERRIERLEKEIKNGT